MHKRIAVDVVVPTAVAAALLAYVTVATTTVILGSSSGSGSSSSGPLFVRPWRLPLRLVVDALTVDQEGLCPSPCGEAWGGPAKARANNRTGAFWLFLAITVHINALQMGLPYRIEWHRGLATP